MTGSALIGAVAPTVSSTVLPVSFSAHPPSVCASSFFRCLVRLLLLSFLFKCQAGLNSLLQLGHWPACMKAGLQVHGYLLVAGLGLCHEWI